MDTTEKYIKMCKKAWSDLKDDCGSYTAVIGQGNDDVFMNDIWLPRQDQLQGMVKERKNTYFLIEDLSDFMTNNLLEDHGNVPYTPPFKEEWEKASLEKLWLAFVMHEKYGKTWNEKKEIWQK